MCHKEFMCLYCDVFTIFSDVFTIISNSKKKNCQKCGLILGHLLTIHLVKFAHVHLTTC